MTGRPRSLKNFTGAGYDKGRPRIVQALWFAVQHLIFMKWWLPGKLRPIILRAFGAAVGVGVIIRHGVRVHWPWKLTIGDHVWIGEGAWLLNLEPIDIGDDVCISQEAVLCTGSHDFRDPAFEFDNAHISVGRGSWLCFRAVILPGVELPPGTVVPAGVLVSPAVVAERTFVGEVQ